MQTIDAISFANEIIELACSTRCDPSGKLEAIIERAGQFKAEAERDFGRERQPTAEEIEHSTGITPFTRGAAKRTRGKKAKTDGADAS